MCWIQGPLNWFRCWPLFRPNKIQKKKNAHFSTMNTLCINLVWLMFEVSVRINACWCNISKLHGTLFDFTFMESLCDVLFFLWANKNSLFLDPCQMIVKSHVLHLFPVSQTGSHYNKHLISRQVFKTKNCNPFQSSSGLSICVSFSNCCVIYAFFFFFNVWWQFSLFEFWCIFLMLNKVFIK